MVEYLTLSRCEARAGFTGTHFDRGSVPLSSVSHRSPVSLPLPSRLLIYYCPRESPAVRFNPPLPTISGPVVRLVVGGVSPQMHLECILDYMADAMIALNPAVLSAFLVAWRANCQTSWLAAFATDYAIDNYSVADISSGTTPTLEVTGLTIPGTVAGDSLNSVLAGVATKYTAVKGQHGRGRLYYGPVPVSGVTPGVDPDRLNAGQIALYAASDANLQLPVVAGGASFRLCVSTRPARPATLVTNAAVVQSMQVQAPLGTVRRRKLGRGI